MDWAIVIILYMLGLGLFQILGGFASAGQAIQRWGRESSIRRAKRLGLTPSSPSPGAEL